MVTIAASGPPLTPDFVWYDPSNAGSIVAVAGFVTAFADLSAAGNNLVTDSGGPQTGAQTIGGLNAMTYAVAHGNSNLKTPGNITQANPITVYQVVQFLDAPAAALYQFLVNASVNPAVLTDGTGHWAYFAGSIIGSAVLADTNAHVLAAVFNGASSVLYLDGVPVSTANPGSDAYSGASSPILLGYNTRSERFGLGETLAFKAANTAPQVASVQAYLKAKWSTT